MSINSPGIAAGPTQALVNTYGARVRIVRMNPDELGGTYREVVDEEVVTKSTEPRAHGEIIILKSGQGAASVMSLYVVVDIDGTLSWKKASIIPGFERYTRQPSGNFIT